MARLNAQAAATQKLAVKLGDPELAALLVDAGFDNPAKIRAAEDADLEAVNGIGKSSVAKLRKKLPRRR